MKVNGKYFNISAWIMLFMSFVLPYQYQSSDGFSTTSGFPIAFFTVYDRSVGKTLLSSTHINLLTALINTLIIYFILIFVKSLYDKYIVKLK